MADAQAVCEKRQRRLRPSATHYHSDDQSLADPDCICAELQAAYDAGKADRTTCDSTSPGHGIGCIRIEGHEPLFHIGPNGAAWKSARGEDDGCKED